MTTMTHMEQGFADDREESVFLQHVNQLRLGLDWAEEYGALLTVESEKPFATANTKWGLNLMAEIVARGQGVGTHCDFGFRDPAMRIEDYAQSFRENKVLVDQLVGEENNLGCSGGGSVNDWAVAASMAGFKYIDGVVTMHYLSMPMEARPGPEWTDDYIRDGNYHWGAPVDLYQRIYPFMVADAQDFVPDENGVILVSSGELGTLSAFGESAQSGEGRAGETPLGNDDTNALVTQILEIDRNRDRTRVAKVTVYLPVSVFVEENEPALRNFFGRMAELEEEGIIRWATQLQVYQAYVAWNP